MFAMYCSSLTPTEQLHKSNRNALNQNDVFLGIAKPYDNCDTLFTLILLKLNVNLHIVEPEDFCQLLGLTSLA